MYNNLSNFDKNVLYHVKNIIIVYLPPVLIVIGTIFNIFSFIVFIEMSQTNYFKSLLNLVWGSFNRFSRSFNKSKSTALYSVIKKHSVNYKNEILTIYFYLSMLALFDIGVLYFGLLSDWLKDIHEIGFKDKSVILCKSVTFLAYLSSHMSSFLIVIVNFIRLSTIYSPLKTFSEIFNSNRINIIILFIFSGLILVNVHLFWSMEEFNVSSENENESEKFFNYLHGTFNITNGSIDDLYSKFKLEMGMMSSRKMCRIVENYFTVRIWPIMDKLLYSLVPFVVISTMNYLIIKNVRKSNNAKYVFYTSRIKSDTCNEGVQLISMNFDAMRRSNSTFASARSNFNLGLGQISNEQYPKQLRSRKNEVFSRRLTYMLLVTSFCFLFCTFPVTLLFVVLDWLKDILNTDNIEELNRRYEWLFIAQRSASLLMYINHSVNFFIYFFTSFRFRQQFKKMLKTNLNYLSSKLKTSQSSTKFMKMASLYD